MFTWIEDLMELTGCDYLTALREYDACCNDNYDAEDWDCCPDYY